MKNLKKLSRENLKTVLGGTREGCPGPGPAYISFGSQTECENTTGKKCCERDESNCFSAGWTTYLCF